jgi:hypothetical protein
MPMTLYHKSVKLIHEHPYIAGGMALAMTAGLGYGGYSAYANMKGIKGRRLGSKGVIEDGLLKEAIGMSYPGKGAYCSASRPVS